MESRETVRSIQPENADHIPVKCMVIHALLYTYKYICYSGRDALAYALSRDGSRLLSVGSFAGIRVADPLHRPHYRYFKQGEAVLELL